MNAKRCSVEGRCHSMKSANTLANPITSEAITAGHESIHFAPTYATTSTTASVPKMALRMRRPAIAAASATTRMPST